MQASIQLQHNTKLQNTVCTLVKVTFRASTPTAHFAGLGPGTPQTPLPNTLNKSPCEKHSSALEHHTQLPKEQVLHGIPATSGERPALYGCCCTQPTKARVRPCCEITPPFGKSQPPKYHLRPGVKQCEAHWSSSSAAHNDPQHATSWFRPVRTRNPELNTANPSLETWYASDKVLGHLLSSWLHAAAKYSVGM